eukprot:1190697-Prorocentrum_minimum.AAC.6
MKTYAHFLLKQFCPDPECWTVSPKMSNKLVTCSIHQSFTKGHLWLVHVEGRVLSKEHSDGRMETL